MGTHPPLRNRHAKKNMNKPEGIALEFARMILGWPDACKKTGHPCYYGKIYKDSDSANPAFHYYNFSEIEKYVQAWCNKNNQGFDIHYGTYNKGYETRCGGKDSWDEKMGISLMKVLIAAENGA